MFLLFIINNPKKVINVSCPKWCIIWIMPFMINEFVKFDVNDWFIPKKKISGLLWLIICQDYDQINIKFSSELKYWA